MATGTFLDEIALGRYVDGNSPFHRSQVAWKAVLFSFVGVATFWLTSATAFLLLGALLGLLARACGLPGRLFWRSLRPVALLALFTIFVGAYFRSGDSSWDGLVFSWQGLHEGGLFAARLFLITLLTTLFFLTTRPGQTVRLGIQVLSPLRLMGMERQELSLLVHLAYRFVPLLCREVEEMILGRKARGLPAPKSWWGKGRARAQQLLSLFVGALQRADSTALALEQRRVLESWTQEGEPSGYFTGLGGWQSFLLLGLTAAVLVADSGMF